MSIGDILSNEPPPPHPSHTKKIVSKILLYKTYFSRAKNGVGVDSVTTKSVCDETPYD